jgi:hypothetical protein
MAVLSGIGLPLSGLANHILGFDALTVQRHAWMAAHNMMGIVFAVFVGWHIALNWRPLTNHMRAAAGALPRRETVLAGAIVAGLLTLAVGHAFIVAPHN